MNSDKIGFGLAGKVKEQTNIDTSKYWKIGPLKAGIYELYSSGAFLYQQGATGLTATDATAWPVPASTVERLNVNFGDESASEADAYLFVKSQSGTITSFKMRPRDHFDAGIPTAA